METFAIIPDILTLALGLLVIFIGLFDEKSVGKPAKLPFHVAWIGLISIFYLLNQIPVGIEYEFLSRYKITSFGIIVREILIISALLTIILARVYFKESRDKKPPLRYSSEFIGIIIICTFGGFALVSATELITLFLGLELATIPLYFLVAFHKTQKTSNEAATKYILIGSASTAIMLFGFSYLYGFSGSLDLNAIASTVATSQKNPLIWLAVLMIFAAIGFKLTLFPFHTWAPDVYEGAPTPVTAFLSISSKLIAISFLIIMIYGPFASIHEQLQYLILLLSATTMTVGNLGAMRQRNMRRFLAYSSIAQAGYILLALTGSQSSATSAILFYMLIYALSNYAVFYIFSIVGAKRGEEFASLRGLSKESPVLAAVLAVSMFSLAGIPPVVGFLGKFMLFASAAEAGFYFFIIYAALNSTVSLYYYLLVLKEAYVVEPDEGQNTEPLGFTLGLKITLSALAIAVLFFGLFPQIIGNITKILAA